MPDAKKIGGERLCKHLRNLFSNRNINFKKGKYAAFNADGSVFNTPKSVDDKFDEQRGYPAKDGYQVAELPYNGDTLSMMIFLPTAANGVDTLLSTLTVTQIDTCAGMLDAREYQLSVSKFKLETTYDLIPPLRNHALRKASERATLNAKIKFGQSLRLLCKPPTLRVFFHRSRVKIGSAFVARNIA